MSPLYTAVGEILALAVLCRPEPSPAASGAVCLAPVPMLEGLLVSRKLHDVASTRCPLGLVPMFIHAAGGLTPMRTPSGKFAGMKAPCLCLPGLLPISGAATIGGPIRLRMVRPALPKPPRMGHDGTKLLQATPLHLKRPSASRFQTDFMGNV